MIRETTFMNIASEIAETSYCIKRKVGAIIVKDNNIIAIGYNGTPSGFENVCEIDDPISGTEPRGLITKPEVLHAESNAITKCAKSHNSSQDADIYVTTAPCIQCAKLIIQSGIRRVYFRDSFSKSDGIELLNKANISVLQIINGEILNVFENEYKKINKEFLSFSKLAVSTINGESKKKPKLEVFDLAVRSYKEIEEGDAIYLPNEKKNNITIENTRNDELNVPSNPKKFIKIFFNKYTVINSNKNHVVCKRVGARHEEPIKLVTKFVIKTK